MATNPGESGLSAATETHPRIESIDVLRGLVMVLMAIDHTRDFFTSARFDPLDIQQSWPALYATRWITHFCAPVFVFLAGTGAFLSAARGRSNAEISRLLATRGLWLVIVELTLVRWGWMFNLDFGFVFLQVIWAIGVSMIALSLLVFLPARVVGWIGLGIIMCHNLLDPLTPESFGALAPMWTILHDGGPLPLNPSHFAWVAYPVLPWIGVIAAGWGFGPLLREPLEARRRLIARIGMICVAVFVALRTIDRYGDSNHWDSQSSLTRTLFDFLDVTKYPPSLMFLTATMGPALLLLAWIDGRSLPAFKPLLVFGRVPFFYYVLHIPLIHGLAMLAAHLSGQPVAWLTLNPPAGGPFAAPPGWGWGLPVVYAVWLGVVLALYPACAWFARIKARRRDPWLSYL